VALKVLLADDSVPAQNMGKKILIDAGYEVLTVSNGLEALRKIADMIPDIAILDIFMPGYTGLEICARLRANAATAELPVILTVGKLEPYRPEDGEQVRSNAVIVKPFAAVELTSAVRSLIGARPADVHRDPEAAGLPLEPVGDPHATPGQLAEASREEGPDEPLFSGVESAAAGNTVPLASPSPEAGVDAVAPVQADDEALGAESLVFNPDAGHTPFRASAVEPLPTASHLPAEGGASAFAEFDLEAEASPYSAGPALELSSFDSWPSAPEAAGHSDAAAAAGLAGSEPRAIAAESAIATEVEAAESEEDVCAAVAPVEMDSSPLDVPAIEPLLEVREAAAPGDVAASSEAAEAIVPEDAAANDEVALTATAEPLTQDEEARRLAFEELFNSDVPFPLEGDTAPFTEPAMVTQPDVAEMSKHEPCEIEPEPEIVMDGQDTFIASAPDPELMEAVEPVRAFAAVSEGELLLDDESSAHWPSTASEPEAAEAFASAPGESYELQPDVVGDPVPQFYAEAPAEAPEILHAAAAAEIEQTACEAAPEQTQEVAQIEVLPELAYFEPELQQAVVAPQQVAPVQLEPEAEPESVSAPLELASEVLAQPEPEAWVEETSAASGPAHRLHEAERIHKAVEKVFDRFRPLLVAAIVRELARLD
jgi:CheY-like chemotaxis protein